VPIVVSCANCGKPTRVNINNEFGTCSTRCRKWAIKNQLTPMEATMEHIENPIMKYFEYAHLPERLQAVSKPIGELAKSMDANLVEGPEKTEGLRKLLEAKDCLVRASL
jgi:endogenous inhibitor of DNA gyrase (YacG/DUF329 family)